MADWSVGQQDVFHIHATGTQEGMREVSNVASRHNQTFLGGDAVENIE
jgi:hypothetical protein